MYRTLGGIGQSIPINKINYNYSDPQSYTIIENNSPKDLTALGGMLFFSGSDEYMGRELCFVDLNDASNGTQIQVIFDRDYIVFFDFFLVIDGLKCASNMPFVHSFHSLHTLHSLLISILFIPFIPCILSIPSNPSNSPFPLFPPSPPSALLSPQIIDIYPGQGSSSPKGFAASPSALSSPVPYVLFQAYVPATGTELWRTDGTYGGTTLVMDICPGTGGSSPQYITWYDFFGLRIC